MEASSTTAGGSRRAPLQAVLATVRPRQWIKNALVIAAAGAAGALGHDDVPVRVGLACLAFCLLASGIYAVNDVHDAVEDRSSSAQAVAAGRGGRAGSSCGCLAGACADADGVDDVRRDPARARGGGRRVRRADPELHADLAPDPGDGRAGRRGRLRAAGAGGRRRRLRSGYPSGSCWWCRARPYSWLPANGNPSWHVRGDRPGARRRVLAAYSPAMLRLMLTGSAAIALFAYCVWAFELPLAHGIPWRPLTIVPFAACLVRYHRLVLSGDAEAPEDVLLQDRGCSSRARPGCCCSHSVCMPPASRMTVLAAAPSAQVDLPEAAAVSRSVLLPISRSRWCSRRWC